MLLFAETHFVEPHLAKRKLHFVYNIILQYFVSQNLKNMRSAKLNSESEILQYDETIVGDLDRIDGSLHDFIVFRGYLDT